MLEKIYQFLIKATQSLFTLFKVIIRSNIFPQKHIGEAQSCIILGNGPSLATILDQYQQELKQQVLVCVNKFPDTAHYTQLKPSYYVVCSEEFWATDTKDPHHEGRQRMIQAAIEKTNWPLTFFIPKSSKSNPSFLANIQKNPHINLVFYNTTPIEGLPGISNWLLGKGLGSPRPHNVLIPSILQMINSGFKQIYLVGADHSWIPMISVDENNNALVNQQHFYDEHQSKSQQMYRSGKTPRRLHEILEKFMFSFRAYFDLKVLADKKGASIYNCTKGSYIDAFKRKTITDVFN